jgi:hypothetical protein
MRQHVVTLHRAPPGTMFTLELAPGYAGAGVAAYRRVQLNPRVWRHQHPRLESSPRSPGEVDGGLGRVEEGSQGGFVTVDVDECSDVIK